MSKRQNLLNLLSSLYDTVPKVVLVCDICNIDVIKINQNVAVIIFWNEVLKEADKRLRRENLKDIILSDYPERADELETYFSVKEENSPTPLFKILGSPITEFKPVNLYDCNRKRAVKDYFSEIAGSQKMIIHLWGKLEHQPINFSRRIFYKRVNTVFDSIENGKETITDLRDDTRFCVVEFDGFNENAAFVNDIIAKLKSGLANNPKANGSGNTKKDFLTVAIIYDIVFLETNIEKFKQLNILLSEQVKSKFDLPIHIFFCIDGIDKSQYKTHPDISNELNNILNEDISLIRFDEGVSWEDIKNWVAQRNRLVLENNIVKALIHFGLDEKKVLECQSGGTITQKDIESFQYRLYEEWQISNRIN